jgi:hypothetical protein
LFKILPREIGLSVNLKDSLTYHQLMRKEINTENKILINELTSLIDFIICLFGFHFTKLKIASESNHNDIEGDLLAQLKVVFFFDVEVSDL